MSVVFICIKVKKMVIYLCFKFLINMTKKHSLNQNQKEAIEYISGPLLIVAGAGTGKTTVITEKIAYLIKNNLAKPEEILALTFTEKAAEEMEDRVSNLLDIGYTEMQISTFHAFCQRILENYALDIGLPNQFKRLNQIDAWLLIRENLNKFNLDYYRPLGNPTRHIHELIKHFSKCKDELITPQEYFNYAKSIKLSTAEVNKDEKIRLIEIANAYQVYNQVLLDNNSLDFGDLIFYTVKLLQKRKNILKFLQKQFKYILVDEFQDVNHAQYELVNLLFNKEFNQLTVVGDDDQSIYAFRGASVSNILRFKDDFVNSKEIVLTENYRSGQEILDLAYQSIQNNNPDRLEVKLNLNKRLISNKKGSKIEHLQGLTLEEEAEKVAEKILEIKKNEVASWDDFLILARANSHVEPFIAEFEKRGIPFEFLASSGLFHQPIVMDAINFLKVIDQYRESSSLYRLLLLPFLNINEEDLQKITYFAKKKSISYFDVLKRAFEAGVSENTAKMTTRLLNLLKEGMKNAKSHKPTTLLLDFFENSGYFSYLIKQEKKNNQKVIKQIYQLKEFFSYLKKFEENNPEARVVDFIEYYNYVVQAGDEGALYQPNDTPESVNIMTIHGAKGLEAKYVFIVNMVEERFPTRRRGEAIELPTELIRESLPEGDFHIQEERRLFYVAVTRAKEKLFFSSAEDYGGTRSKKISRFLSEIDFVKNNFKNIKEKIKIIDNFIKKKTKTTSLEKNIYELPDKFSYSQINSYQHCPYQYKLAHVLKIPTKGSASLSFGQSIHNTLHKFYNKVIEMNSIKQESLFNTVKKTESKTGQIKVPTLEDLLSLYEESWIDDWYESTRQRELYYKKGKNILKIFYKSQENNWTIPVSLEGWFKIKVGDYFINGRIDRIDQLADGSLEIIDYKTGKAKENLVGDDKNQLLIYQIAAQSLPQYKNIGEVGKLSFYYLEDGTKLEFIGKEKDLENLKEKIIKTIEEIKNNNFKAKPNQFICKKCDFRDICEYRKI